MPHVHSDHVKPEDKIIVGARGKLYVVRNGRKYYVTDKKYEPNRQYKPKPGAYNRFVQSQMNAITCKPQVGNTHGRGRNNRNGTGISTQECQEPRNRTEAA